MPFVVPVQWIFEVANSPIVLARRKRVAPDECILKRGLCLRSRRFCTIPCAAESSIASTPAAHSVEHALLIYPFVTFDYAEIIRILSWPLGLVRG